MVVAGLLREGVAVALVHPDKLLARPLIRSLGVVIPAQPEDRVTEIRTVRIIRDEVPVEHDGVGLASELVIRLGQKEPRPLFDFAVEGAHPALDLLDDPVVLVQFVVGLSEREPDIGRVPRVGVADGEAFERAHGLSGPVAADVGHADGVEGERRRVGVAVLPGRFQVPDPLVVATELECGFAHPVVGPGRHLGRRRGVDHLAQGLDGAAIVAFSVEIRPEREPGLKGEGMLREALLKRGEQPRGLVVQPGRESGLGLKEERLGRVRMLRVVVQEPVEGEGGLVIEPGHEGRIRLGVGHFGGRFAFLSEGRADGQPEHAGRP